MQEDRAKHKILPPSKFGLIQITRQRVRPEMKIKTREANPSNTKHNEVEAPIILINKLAQELDELVRKGKVDIQLNIHPFIAAFLEKGYPSIRLKWYFKHKLRLHLRSNNAYKFLQYTFFDPSNNTITF